MPDVFISYSRRNLDFVQQLVAALKARDKDPWFDQLKEPLTGIAAGAPWWKQIQDGIEGVDNFLFVISPDSISSPYCHAEINYAREHGKRLVPLLYCGWIGESETRTAIDAAIEAISDDEAIPDTVTSSILNLKKLVRANWLAISEIQYVPFSSSFPFEQSLEQLVQALDLDLAWVKMHSQLVQAAKLWEANNFHDDYLWGATRLKPVYEMIERRKPELDALVQKFIKPEQERLLAEINNINTTHQRRSAIGERLSVIGDARDGVGLRDGIPWIEWCAVPGGEIRIKDQIFRMQPFYIAKYLITYSQFETFIDNLRTYHDARWWESMPEEYHHQPVELQRSRYASYPRDRVSWYQAVAFTRWLQTHLQWKKWLPERLIAGAEDNEWGVRLPTEWEWQWAAQAGNEQREYPWEGEFDSRIANTSDAGIGSRSTAVGMYPHGAAACGALDMAGNVWEWCLSDYGKIPEYRQIGNKLYFSDEAIARTRGSIGQISYSNNQKKVLRGGAFNEKRDRVSVSARNYAEPWSPSYGFRVAVGTSIFPSD